MSDDDEDIPGDPLAFGADLPEERVVLAARLTHPSEGEYLVVIDRDGKIKTEAEAKGQALELSFYTSLPLVVAFRQGGSGLWHHVGPAPFARTLLEVQPDQLHFEPVLLKRPTRPDL